MVYFLITDGDSEDNDECEDNVRSEGGERRREAERGDK